MTDGPDRPIASPCLKRCRLDSARRACMDCGRTLDEIAGWAGFSEAERRRIMAELPARREKEARLRQIAAQQQQ